MQNKIYKLILDVHYKQYNDHRTSIEKWILTIVQNMFVQYEKLSMLNMIIYCIFACLLNALYPS